MKKVVILQSNYIPWRGYFDLIAVADEFVIYDDVQYTKRDWRNRNQIKTPTGLLWLNIPVFYRSRNEGTQKINETEIQGNEWAKEHWLKIKHNYAKTPCFNEISSILEPLYLSAMPTNLSSLNRLFIESICEYLGITTKITNSWDYTSSTGKTERLVDICLQAGATEYISGPAAQAYIKQSIFDDVGIKLTWFDYSGYPQYQQLWGDFEPKVSIIDLLFNCGKESHKYMKFKD